MNKRIGLILFFFALQFIFLIAVNRFFISDMREDAENVQQELIAKGMQSEQVSVIRSAMRSTATNVSGYVFNVTFMLITSSMFMLVALTKKEE